MPKAIRQALGVGCGDRIALQVEDGAVSVHAVSAEGGDPALAPFLTLLDRDMATRPAALVPLAQALAERIAAASLGVNDDPDARIDGKVAL